MHAGAQGREWPSPGFGPGSSEEQNESGGTSRGTQRNGRCFDSVVDVSTLETFWQRGEIVRTVEPPMLFDADALNEKARV